MNKSTVYFLNARNRHMKSPGQRFLTLLQQLNWNQFKQYNTVALKIHFGEEGATGYIHHVYPRVIVDHLKSMGLRPFLTDTNTLYHGKRSNGVDHLELAFRNGFSYDCVNAPLVIADGIRSHSVMEIPAGPKHFKTIKIGSAIHEADCLITMNHFKGHLVTSFGGAIKNLSMGCASRATKQRMHADIKPALKKNDVCTGCGECVRICPVAAIEIKQSKASFDWKRCIGCAECLSACPEGAIRIEWNGSSQSVQEKMAEVALAVERKFKLHSIHINFLLNITPECDCLRGTDNPIVQDIGILASTDPVAIDQASLDLVNAQPSLRDSVLDDCSISNADKFKMVHPDVDPVAQLSYGSEIGLGSRDYELVYVDA